jgi:glucose/arabinose dehydrogenase
MRFQLKKVFALAALWAVVAFTIAANAFSQDNATATDAAAQKTEAQSSDAKPAPSGFQPFAGALKYLSQPTGAAGAPTQPAAPQTALQDKLLKLAVDAGVNWLMNNAATLYAEVSAEETPEEQAEEVEVETSREAAPRNNAELLSDNQSPVFSGNRLMMLSGNRLEVRVITRVEPGRHRHDREDDEADPKERFEKLDADGNGSLTFDEFRGGVESDED